MDSRPDWSEMSNGGISIRPLSNAMIPEVGRLFQKVYNRPFNSAFYSWRFLENPFGPTSVLLALEGEKVVGHYAVCPSMTRDAGGESIRSAQSMTTMTDAAYGGRGIFPRLAEDMYRALHNDHGTELVFGFPNANSHYAFTRKLGWDDVHSLFFMTRPVEGAEASAFRLLDWAGLDPLLDLHENSLVGYQPYSRTREFLRWRYQHNPEQQYCVVAPEGSGDPSVAIVVKEFINERGEAGLDLVDFLGDHGQTSLASAIKAVVSLAQSKSLKTAQAWVDLYHPAFAALERLRFRPGGPITYFGLRSLSARNRTKPNPREWRVTMGDSDVF